MKNVFLFSKLFLVTLLIVSIFTPKVIFASNEGENSKSIEEIELDILNMEDIQDEPDPIGNEHEYARGKSPAITVLDNGLIVAIKELDGILSYQLGEFKYEKIWWTSPINYDAGEEPSITTLPSGDDVMVVNQVFNNDTDEYDIYYTTGQFENGDMNWSERSKYTDGAGSKPSITTVDDSVVMVREYGTELHYSVGVIGETDVNWTLKGKYGEGHSPSITTLDNGDLLALHVEENASMYTMGEIARLGMVWTPSKEWHHTYSYDPAAVQLQNGKIIAAMEYDFLEGNRNLSWIRMGDVNHSTFEINWADMWTNHLNGSKNDLALLKDGYTVLNVRQGINDNVLWYSLGKQTLPHLMEWN
ncbi:hypothetical protein [Jeotgalibacillus marinus]|uniref:Uncharacterized protein n=1 Tax=Jeotgalibacillus marinus TaxID=86667 RepID=A0ABV3Q760_9BACL